MGEKVKWRTMARRAAAEKDPEIAKKLRAKSAAMRRAERMEKKTKVVSRPKKARKVAATMNTAKSVGKMGSAETMVFAHTGISDTGLPKWEKVDTIVTKVSDIDLQAEAKLLIEKLKESGKLGKAAIDIAAGLIGSVARRSEFNGSSRREDIVRARGRIVETERQDRSVSRFMAVIDHWFMVNGGNHPDIVVVNGSTIEDVMAVLRRAGYPKRTGGIDNASDNDVARAS